MATKVTFDPVDRLIRVTLAPDANGDIYFDIKRDLYSEGKEDWQSTETLRRVEFPITSVAGNDLPGEKSLGSTFFMRSDWKVELYPANHRFIVNGNFYSEDGSDPFVDPVGSYAIRVMQQVSSLVDSTVQQLPEIEYASFNGGITYDEANGYSGTGYTLDGRIIGTPRAPSNNVIDAQAIAESRGFTAGFVIGEATFTEDVDVEKFEFIGTSKDITHVHVEDLATIDDCIFQNMYLTGYLDGNSRLLNCRIADLDYIKGTMEQCLLEPGTIKILSGGTAYILDSWTGHTTTMDNLPTIDMNGSGQSLVIRNHNGAIKIINKTGPETIVATLDGGSLFIDLTTVTDGVIITEGVGSLLDAATRAYIPSGDYGNLTIQNSLISTKTIAADVWTNNPVILYEGNINYFYAQHDSNGFAPSMFLLGLENGADYDEAYSGFAIITDPNTGNNYPVTIIGYLADGSLYGLPLHILFVQGTSATTNDWPNFYNIGASIKIFTSSFVPSGFSNASSTWNYTDPNHPLEDTPALVILKEIQTNAAFIKNIEGGKWEIIDNQMIFYADDNITEVARFNLFNSAGDLAETNIVKRVRV